MDGNATVPVNGLLAAAAQPPETEHQAQPHEPERELAGPIRLTGGLAATQQQLTPAAARSRQHAEAPTVSPD